jgi:hypothetical protein
MSKKDGIFKVVKIIDNYNLVINAGKNVNVEVGDKFEIFESGKEIFDPDTGDSLGKLDFVKAYIKVTSVLDHMSICQNTDSDVINPLTPVLLRLERYKPAPLNIDSTDISGGYEDVDKKIHVGDKVRFS